ncbi:MAG: PAS-domain containing protein [Acetobacteraceae bacterium]
MSTRRANPGRRPARPDAARLAAVLEALPEGVILFDAERRVVLTNPAYDRLMAGAEARPGETIEAVIRVRIAAGEYGPGDPEALLVRHLSYDFSLPQTRRRRRPNGTSIENRWIPLPDGGFMGVVRDITPQVEADAALRRRGEETAILLAGMRQGLILWGPDRRLILANPMAATLIGIPPEYLSPGCTHAEFIDRILAGGYLGAGPLAHAMAAELKSRDWGHSWVRHFVNAAGRFVERRADPAPGGMSITTFTDMTEVREAEHALRRAKEAAEAASQAKSRFLATMSHELRTPLNTVIGFSETLAAEIAAGRGADYARAINAAGRQLLGLIDTLLDVARLESGRFDLVEDIIAPTRLIAACLRQFETAARAAEITLVGPDPEPALPDLLVDRRRLSQALHQLVSNAVKFTPAGGTVRVGAGRDGEALLITVADTGIGIAEDDLARVFDPFVQLDASLARRFTGAGLGLYLARALVESHGGTLVLSSAPGAGTTAALRLPAHRLRLPLPQEPP